MTDTHDLDHGRAELPATSRTPFGHPPRFRSRRDAGRALARALAHYAGRPDVLVVALGASGVATAHEVARALDAPLELFLTLPLSAPGHEDLAVGMITSGGSIVVNRELMTRLRIPFALLRDAIVRTRADLERRERAFRGDRARERIGGRAIVLTSDALTTGAAELAAIAALRHAGATRIVCALPVASPEGAVLLRRASDECVCLHTPKPYLGAGAWYEDFRAPLDTDARALLFASAARHTTPSSTRSE